MLSDQAKSIISFDHVMSVSRIDAHAIVLQVWCMLNSKKNNLFISPEKEIIYSIDNFILSQLKAHKELDLYAKNIGHHPLHTFILAYFIAIATLRWGDQIIINSKLGKQLIAANQSREYYALHENENLSVARKHPFFIYQKQVVHLFAKSYAQTDDFNLEVERGISTARQVINDFMTQSSYKVN